MYKVAKKGSEKACGDALKTMDAANDLDAHVCIHSAIQGLESYPGRGYVST